MSCSEKLTLVALVLNFIALCAVAYQTYLNRKSIELAKTSIDDDRKTRQLELLPKARFIFIVQNDLETWMEEINKIIGYLEDALRTKDKALVKALSKNGLNSPKDLINRRDYEKCPTWLSQIWISCAQYYYDFKAPIKSLDKMDFSKSWDFVTALISRGKSNSKHIESLLKYIDFAIPDSYAESPSSERDEAFLSD